MALKIALYGKSGSGKSTVAGILVGDYGLFHCKTGKACRQLCADYFGSEDKALMNRVTDLLRGIDESVWLRAALRELPVESTDRVVFDSMRFESDRRYLREQGFVSICIYAPLDLRVQRLRNREQIFDPSQDDDHPAEVELAGKDFDFTIDNISDIAALAAQVHEIVGKIKP